MDIPKLLYDDAIISEEERQKIEQYESSKLFSVHWEAWMLLFIGILLLILSICAFIYLN